MHQTEHQNIKYLRMQLRSIKAIFKSAQQIAAVSYTNATFFDLGKQLTVEY
jgi:hypothetical protein